MENSEQTGVSQKNQGDLTQLLDNFRDGNRGALDEAFAIVYGELRRLAQQHLGNEKPGHTLVATALVHEAYLKLLGNPLHDWHGRAHFFSVASRAMRQILVEYARRRTARKRGGEQHRTTLQDQFPAADMNAEELLALNEGLDRLAGIDDRLRVIVEYRFFGGLTDVEIAELLGVSTRTIERDWVRARAWLYKELYPENPDSSSK
ncbi:MAG: sigma-70 family RNA polymerase sigma factor [Bryobacteraceae bacterium]